MLPQPTKHPGLWATPSNTACPNKDISNSNYQFTMKRKVNCCAIEPLAMIVVPKIFEKCSLGGVPNTEV